MLQYQLDAVQNVIVRPIIAQINYSGKYTVIMDLIFLMKMNHVIMILMIIEDKMEG